MKKLCLNLDQQADDANYQTTYCQKLEKEVETQKTSLNLISNECCKLKKEINTKELNLEEITKQTEILLNEKNQLEFNKIDLSRQIDELCCDITALKKELVVVEKNKLQNESEKRSTQEKLEIASKDIDKLNELLCQVQKEKSFVCNKLTIVARKKENMNVDILRLKQKLEQVIQINNRLNKQIEDLIHQNESKDKTIEKKDKEISKIHYAIGINKHEKEMLDSRLQESFSIIQINERNIKELETKLNEYSDVHDKVNLQLQTKRKELENSDKSILILKQKFSSSVAKLETDFVQKLTKLKSFVEDNIQKFNLEKAHLQKDFERRLHQALANLEMQKNIEIEKLREQRYLLQNQCDSLSQSLEQALIKFEHEKQERISMIQMEKQQMQEKVDKLIMELESECERKNKINRENKTKQDQDKNFILQLRDELFNVKAKLDSNKQSYDAETQVAQLSLQKLNNEKEVLLRDLAESKVLLKLEENKNEKLQMSTSETMLKLVEGK